MHWTLIFTESLTGKRWWDVFTKENYRHVLALGYEPNTDVWVLADWGADSFDLQPLTEDQVTNLIAFADRHDFEAYKVPRSRPSHIRGPRFPFWPFWCTDACKHIVGIRSWAVTPWQLRQHLKRNGYERAFRNGQSGRRIDQDTGAEQGSAEACEAAGP